jgi:hypothetical protein
MTDFQRFCSLFRIGFRSLHEISNWVQIILRVVLEIFFFVHILSKERRRRRKNGVIKWQPKLSWMANFQKKEKKNRWVIIRSTSTQKYPVGRIGAGGRASGRTVESVNNSCFSLSRPTRSRYSFVCGLN